MGALLPHLPKGDCQQVGALERHHSNTALGQVLPVEVKASLLAGSAPRTPGVNIPPGECQGHINNFSEK